MRQTMARVLMLGASGVAWALVQVATLEAQTKLTISGQTRSVACADAGDTVQIAGSRNTITVTGECRKVDISGTGNTVAIEAVGLIEVTGTNNKVTWQRALGGAEPRVSLTGSSTITKAPRPGGPAKASPSAAPPQSAAPAPSAAPASPSSREAPLPDAPGANAAPATAPAAASPDAAAPRKGAPGPGKGTTAARTRPGVTQPSVSATTVKLLEDDREDTVECNGREVTVLGSRNSLRLSGSCPLVIVSGSDNVLDIDAADRIRTTGDRNKLTWTRVTSGTEPRVQNTGTDNRVSRADRKPASP